MSALKLIYDKLHNGEVFGQILPHRLGGTFFWAVLYIKHNGNGDYICWRNYGSSAEKVSLKNLEWVLKEIFRMTPEQFLYSYTTYRTWDQIDQCYQHIQEEEFTNVAFD